MLRADLPRFLVSAVVKFALGRGYTFECEAMKPITRNANGPMVMFTVELTGILFGLPAAVTRWAVNSLEFEELRWNLLQEMGAWLRMRLGAASLSAR